MSKESALSSVSVPTPTPVIAAVPDPGTPPITNPDIPQPDAARFAALARKEAELVKQQREFKRNLELHNVEKEKVRGIATKAQEFEALRASDPIAALKSIGFSETDIFNFMANQPEQKEPTLEERAVKAAREATEARLKEEKEAQAKEAGAAEERRNTQLISDLKTETGNFIEANKETMPYCAFYGPVAVEQAYELIKENLKATDGKELLTVKEALEMAETYYVEQDEAMSKIRKPKVEESKPEPSAKSPERTRTVSAGDPTYKHPETITRTRTISNRTGVTSVASIPKQESRDEKRSRLIETIRAGGLRK